MVAAQLSDELEQVTPASRVGAAGGFVQEEEIWIVHQGCG